MDIINNEKKYPTLVEVVNNPQNPTQTEVVNLPITGGSIKVTLTGNAASIGLLWRPPVNNFNVSLDNILLLQSDGTFVPIPLNTSYVNLTSANIDAMLASYKIAYATLVSGVTSATLHYSKLSSTGVVTSEVYNLKD